MSQININQVDLLCVECNRKTKENEEIVAIKPLESAELDFKKDVQVGRSIKLKSKKEYKGSKYI